MIKDLITENTNVSITMKEAQLEAYSVNLINKVTKAKTKPKKTKPLFVFFPCKVRLISQLYCEAFIATQRSELLKVASRARKKYVCPLNRRVTEKDKDKDKAWSAMRKRRELCYRAVMSRGLCKAVLRSVEFFVPLSLSGCCHV